MSDTLVNPLHPVKSRGAVRFGGYAVETTECLGSHEIFFLFEGISLFSVNDCINAS